MLKQGLMITALAFAVPCVAASGAERWTATSNTASSITGNVTLEANRIVFSGGKFLPIAREKNITFNDGMGNRVPASLYRVTAPDDPPLLRGNRICGQPGAKVTYLIIWHARPVMPGQPDGRAFAAYLGNTEPSPTADGACGTFFYEIGR